MDYHLESRGLTVVRGGVHSLSDVSVRFHRGRVTGLVGPSGAGKSTLLRCLNGLEAQAQGDVVLDGTDINAIEPIELRRRVGLIFQLPMMFEGSVRDNLNYGLDAAVADVEAALDKAALDRSFLDRPAASLSVGEAQRVSIARALLRDPEVLLMDEPTSALDRDSRKTIEDLVRSLGEDGLTVVLVTHDLAQAERVAEIACLLVDGTVRATGAPTDLHDMWDEHR